MNFFLCNLLVAGICSTSSRTPRRLVHFLPEKKTTSFAQGGAQLFLLAVVGVGVQSNLLLLATRAHACYMAVCVRQNSTHVV